MSYPAAYRIESLAATSNRFVPILAAAGDAGAESDQRIAVVACERADTIENAAAAGADLGRLM